MISEQGEINFSQDNGRWTGHALFGKFLHSIYHRFGFCQWRCVLKFLLVAHCCFQSSVNGKEAKIPFPWLVFNEKVKVNSVFLRDSTAISDSILLLFGGNIQQGGLVSSFSLLTQEALSFRLANASFVYFLLHVTGRTLENAWRLSGVLHEL